MQPGNGEIYNIIPKKKGLFTSSGVIVSALPITGMMLILSCNCFINSMSRGFNPGQDQELQ